MRDNPKVARTRVASTLRVLTVRIAFFINHRPFRVTFLSVARLSTWYRMVTAHGVCLLLCLTALGKEETTPEQLEFFERKIQPVLDRLIDSPACGDRWARKSI